MENNANSWMDRRLSALDPPSEWQPDSSAALMRLRRREHRRSIRRNLYLAFAAAAACAIVVSAIGYRPFRAHRSAAAPVLTAGLRESGRADAPVLCEMYSDYECGHCARMFRETLPQLVAAYVQTGKVRLLHRDFPLPSHRFARLAARYANAAGRLGRYELAAAEIFRSQGSWAATGDLESRLAAVFPAGDMAKLRTLVKNPDLDLAIDVDVEMARREKISDLPALVCAIREKRHVWAPVPAYPALKNYLDEMLETNCHEGARTASC